VEIGEVLVVEVAATRVERDHVRERRVAAIVEVGSGQLHIAQRRDLERAVRDDALARRDRREQQVVLDGCRVQELWRASDSGLPNGSFAPSPMSSVVLRTPML